MLVVLDYVKTGPDTCRTYAYTQEDNHTSVQDARHAEALIDALAGEDGIVLRGMPPVDKPRLFVVYLGVYNNHGDSSQYAIDYKASPGCPSSVIYYGMEMYRELKKRIRMVRKNNQTKGKKPWPKFNLPQ